MLMTNKLKLADRLKPIPGRKEENKSLVPTLKKLPPLVNVDHADTSKGKSNHRPLTTDFNRLLYGDLTQEFPKQNSRLFRIFLSSTFSDFKIERNEVYRRVFPSIKQRCAELGYEFQVVDMR